MIKGGLLEGRVLTTDEITALSKIAPREELLARLAGGMAAPMQQFAALLAALPQKLAYALSALIEQGGAPGAPESAAPAEDAADDENADEAPAEDAASDEPEAEAAADEAPAEDEGDAADDGGESADEAPAEAEASEEDTAGDAGDEESGDASEEQES